MIENDIELFYTEQGVGENLIFLHGNGEDQEYFVNQLPYFATKYRVIAIDTRGHGKTKRGDKPFTIRQFADDLNYFMEKNGIEKASILGFSDGGNIAMVFAMKYPEKVGKLIINGGNLDARGVKRAVQLPIEMGYFFAKFLSRFNKKITNQAEMLGLMVVDPNIKSEELKKITAETLVIAGTKDLIKEEHTKEIYQMIPNAQIAFVKGNHFVAKHNPKEFNEKVFSFLKE